MPAPSPPGRADQAPRRSRAVGSTAWTSQHNRLTHQAAQPSAPERHRPTPCYAANLARPDARDLSSNSSWCLPPTTTQRRLVALDTWRSLVEAMALQQRRIDLRGVTAIANGRLLAHRLGVADGCRRRQGAAGDRRADITRTKTDSYRNLKAPERLQLLRRHAG